MTIFRYRSARRGKSVDSADFSAMAAVFPGVSSERRHESLRDFLKGRHGVFLRGVYRVEVP